ncbi:MAG TPA: Mur ligase family protein, partial [Thermomicrobiales bacterium]|nr:Mur ligase family protein [Thermomicrobiales bacterium]
MTSNGKIVGFDPRLSAALLIAKVTAAGIRLAGRGGGTSAPGLVADRIDSGMLGKLTRRLPGGVVMVAGTNGKTTTSRMIADLLAAAGMPVVHNRSGSNLVRGVVSAFARQASVTGAPGGEVGVIESDEAALPQLLDRVTPRAVLLNNLFRDQLDRYGELDAIARKWQPALKALDRETTVVVNADDPTLVALTTDLRAEVVRFGMDDEPHRLETLSHAADAVDCHVCGADLEYRALYVSHLGDWYCPNCGYHRPSLDVIGREVTLRGVTSLGMHVMVDGEEVPIHVGVPGLYNAYNLVAAVAVGRTMAVEMPVITRAMDAFRSAFGRIERVVYRNRTLTLALVKNPVGFNEVLRMLTAESGGIEVPTLIAINDLYA